jgi:hypothetical protein
MNTLSELLTINKLLKEQQEFVGKMLDECTQQIEAVQIVQPHHLYEDYGFTREKDHVWTFLDYQFIFDYTDPNILHIRKTDSLAVFHFHIGTLKDFEDILDFLGIL